MESPLECQERDMIWKSPAGRDESVSARSWQPILLLEEKAAGISHTNPCQPRAVLDTFPVSHYELRVKIPIFKHLQEHT